MTNQSQILEQMQKLVMNIIQNGQTTIDEAHKMDELEKQLHKERCFKKSKNTNYPNQGEEIANLFFQEKFPDAIEKMYEYKIPPVDFFGFIEYQYDDEHEDEDEIEIFTSSFIEKVNQDYKARCEA